MAIVRQTLYKDSRAGRYVGGYGNCYMCTRLNITQSYNPETNTSDITWVLRYWEEFDFATDHKGTFTGSITGAVNQSINIYVTAGTTLVTSVEIASGTLTGVPHNSDGSLSLTFNLNSLTTNNWASGFGIYLTDTATFVLDQTPATDSVVYLHTDTGYVIGEIYVFTDEWKMGEAFVWDGEWKQSSL